MIGESDKPVAGPWQFSLKTLLVSVTLASVLLGGLFNFQDFWVLVYLWPSCLALPIALGIRALRDEQCADKASLRISLGLLVGSVITWALFLMAFVVNRSSSISSDPPLPSDPWLALWRSAWPILFFADPMALLAAIACSSMPPSARQNAGSWAARMLTVLACVLACYALYRYAPPSAG